MMKKIILSLLLTILFTGQASAATEPIVGHAVFFYLDSSADENAVYDDFSYYLNSINPWLAEKNIVVAFIVASLEMALIMNLLEKDKRSE